MPIICPTCLGAGKVPDKSCAMRPPGYYAPNDERMPRVCCPVCKGAGWADDAPRREKRYFGNLTLPLATVTP